MNESLAGTSGFPPPNNQTPTSGRPETNLIPGRPPISDEEYHRFMFVSRFVVGLTTLSAVVLSIFAVQGGNYPMLGVSVLMVGAAATYYALTWKKIRQDMKQNPLHTGETDPQPPA